MPAVMQSWAARGRLLARPARAQTPPARSMPVRPGGRTTDGRLGGIRTEDPSPEESSQVAVELSRFVKAYDVRGTVPDQLGPEVARAFGAAFVRVLGRTAPVPAIVVGYDMRPSSPELADAFAAGATAEGADVVLAGLGSTDLLYFAAGDLDLPGAMFTASHNPAQYNGIKLCRAAGLPVGQDRSLTES